MEHAIATKKPEEMTEEELEAKRKFDEWYRQDQEERERQRKKSEEEAKAYREKYWKMVSQNEKQASERSLEWFAGQVSMSCKAEPPVRLDMTAEVAEQYLRVAYVGEVQRRGCTMKDECFVRIGRSQVLLVIPQQPAEATDEKQKTV